MTIDDYRVQFGWSKRHMAEEADIDANTLRNAIEGKAVYRASAGKIANAINQQLKQRGEALIKYTDLEGIKFAD